MSLISFQLPAEKLDLLNHQITFRQNKLASASESQRRTIQSEIDNLKTVYGFITSRDDSLPYSTLSFPVAFSQNNGAMANLDIFFSLSPGGDAKFLENKDLALKIQTELRSQFSSLESLRLEITNFPNIFVLHLPSNGDLNLIRINQM